MGTLLWSGIMAGAAAEPESAVPEAEEEPQPANRPIIMTTASSRHSVFFMLSFLLF